MNPPFVHLNHESTLWKSQSWIHPLLISIMDPSYFHLNNESTVSIMDHSLFILIMDSGHTLHSFQSWAYHFSSQSRTHPLIISIIDLPFVNLNHGPNLLSIFTIHTFVIQIINNPPLIKFILSALFIHIYDRTTLCIFISTMDIPLLYSSQ